MAGLYISMDGQLLCHQAKLLSNLLRLCMGQKPVKSRCNFACAIIIILLLLWLFVQSWLPQTWEISIVLAQDLTILRATINFLLFTLLQLGVCDTNNNYLVQLWQCSSVAFYSVHIHIHCHFLIIIALHFMYMLNVIVCRIIGPCKVIVSQMLLITNNYYAMRSTCIGHKRACRSGYHNSYLFT